jgi:undecaprenyl-diphosphatase
LDLKDEIGINPRIRTNQLNTLETFLLGAVQGLTEFLPVSSSGHLVIFQHILGFQQPELLLDTVLHLGTLLAVALYFRKDLRQVAKELWPPRREKLYHSMAGWILIGSLPTALIGFFFRTPLEAFFGSVSTVGFMLLTTGLFLTVTRFLPKGYCRRRQLGVLTALAIGTAQGLAIIPGISRSGATIVCGLLLGLERELAGKFAFLLAIPAILGALALQSNTAAPAGIGLSSLLVGFTVSAAVGLAALGILMRMVCKGELAYFAPYCWALGLFSIFFQAL